MRDKDEMLDLAPLLLAIGLLVVIFDLSLPSDGGPGTNRPPVRCAIPLPRADNLAIGLKDIGRKDIGVKDIGNLVFTLATSLRTRAFRDDARGELRFIIACTENQPFPAESVQYIQHNLTQLSIIASTEGQTPTATSNASL